MSERQSPSGNILTTQRTEIGGYWQQRYRYNGKGLHSNSGLLDYGFRYYRVSAEGRDDPSVGRFMGVDPLAEEMPGWNPYNYVFNNPILLIDPDGRAPDDWVKKPDGQIVNTASVTDQNQATTTYGQGAEYLGSSGLLMSDNGNQISLNTNGTATRSIQLSGVTITGQRSDGKLGTLSNANTGVSGAIDTQTGVTLGAGKISRLGNDVAPIVKGLDALSGPLGWTGAAISIGKAGTNPSAGNLLNAGIDVGLAALKVTPGVGAAIGIIDFALTVSGAKDSMFNAVNNRVDRFQTNQVLNAEQVDLSKTRLR